MFDDRPFGLKSVFLSVSSAGVLREKNRPIGHQLFFLRRGTIEVVIIKEITHVLGFLCVAVLLSAFAAESDPQIVSSNRSL